MPWKRAEPSKRITHQRVPISKQRVLIGAQRGARPFPVPNAVLYSDERLFWDFRRPLYDEGWKLHVRIPDDETLGTRYQTVFRLLQRQKIPHKYVGDALGMREMERGGQSGKFLTIYPGGADEMRRLVRDLESWLRPERKRFRFSRPARGDLVVGSLGIITARYGGLTSRYVLTAEAWRNPGADLKHANSYTLDDRTRCKPDHIRNPFRTDSTGADGWCQFPVMFRPHARNPANFRVYPKDKEGMTYNTKKRMFERQGEDG